MKYIYLEHDQAYFRARPGNNWVDDVYWPLVGWVPYQGDRTKRFMFSDARVEEADCFRGIQYQTRDAIRTAVESLELALRRIGNREPNSSRRKQPSGREWLRFTDAPEQIDGVGFQIIGASKWPRRG